MGKKRRGKACSTLIVTIKRSPRTGRFATGGHVGRGCGRHDRKRRR